MRYLAITIHAPIAAHGDTSMGNWRRSWSRPAKSAILGMVGAALGIDRDDTDQLRAINDGIGYAVRTDASGEAFIDYHTIQAGYGADAGRARTRRYELRAARVETRITHREYRTGDVFTVMLWAHPGAPIRLDQIAAALSNPHWTLYVGRKSCPLALPLNPEIIEAESVPGALEKRPPIPAAIAEAMGIEFAPRCQVAADVDAPGIKAHAIDTRRDRYHHKNTYTARSEHIMEIDQCPSI